MQKKKIITPRLSKKLTKNFMFLITLGSCGTIILTIVFLAVYIETFDKHQIIENAFKDSFDLENGPVISAIEKTVQNTIQPLFYDLFKIKEFYKFLVNNEDIIDDGKYCNLLNIERSKECNKNIHETDINSGDDSSIPSNKYDYGTFKVFLLVPQDENDSTYQQKKQEIEKSIQLFSKLNNLLKAICLTRNIPDSYIQKIKLIHENTGLLYEYPGIDINTQTFQNRKLDDINPRYPGDFTYQYESWFIDAKKLFKKTETCMSISYPYTLDSGSLGITLCVQIKKPETSSNIYICLDYPIEQLHVKMDIVNNELKGFFFLTRIDTSILFYDSFLNMNYFGEYDKAEFSSNDTYFLDELNEYNSNTVNMLNEYNCIKSSEYYNIQNEYNGFYNKDGVKWNYRVYPICFRNPIDDNNINLINIIHVHKDSFYQEFINSKLKLTPEIIVIPVIVFIIQGVILNLISKYLINATAKNIVLPMKNIRKILDNTNSKHSLTKNVSHNEEISTSNSNNNITSNSNQINMISNKELMHKHKIFSDLEVNENDIAIHNHINTEEQHEHLVSSNNCDNQTDVSFIEISESSSDNNSEEEEYLNIRSRDIQDLFCRLINVRNSLSTVNTDNCNISSKLLIDMLFATEKFSQVNNTIATNICNSNVGNLLIECKKYDIAIMHLKESDTLSLSDRNECIRRISNDYHQQSFNSKKISTSFSVYNESKKSYSNSHSHESVNILMDEGDKNKKLIESRYPKLIYAFKHFFKNIRHLEKLRTTYINKKQFLPNHILTEIELYSSKKIHFLSFFSETLDNFLIITNPSISKTKPKHIYALLEKIDFILKYELTSQTITNDTFKNIKSYINKAKELIKSNIDINKPKQILKTLIKDNVDINSFDLPNDILKQKLLYMQGKLALFCNHYTDASKYFTKIIYKHGILISDAKITVKAIKKIIYISKMYLYKYELLKKEKEISLLKEYIASKEKEILKFTYEHKDFFILINSHNPSSFIKIALEKTRHILENFVIDEDRFCIAFVNKSDINIMSSFQQKGNISSDYFFDFFQTLIQDKYFLDKTSLKGEEHFKEIFLKCKGIINKKKNSSQRRQIYYVIISDKLSQNGIEFLSSVDFMNIINWKEENIVLCLNTNPFDENDFMKSYKKRFESNMNKLTRSGIVWINDLEELRKKFTMYGNVNRDEMFSLEKYIP